MPNVRERVCVCVYVCMLLQESVGPSDRDPGPNKSDRVSVRPERETSQRDPRSKTQDPRPKTRDQKQEPIPNSFRFATFVRTGQYRPSTRTRLALPYLNLALPFPLVLFLALPLPCFSDLASLSLSNPPESTQQPVEHGYS